MAKGWRGNSEAHARVGRLGGLKSAQNRRKNRDGTKKTSR